MVSVLTSILAFSFPFLTSAFNGAVSAATISRGFYGYFYTFFQTPEFLVVTSIILLLGLLTIWGITQSVTIAAVLTIIEISGLLLIIWAGKDLLGNIPATSSRITGIIRRALAIIEIYSRPAGCIG